MLVVVAALIELMLGKSRRIKEEGRKRVRESEKERVCVYVTTFFFEK